MVSLMQSVCLCSAVSRKRTQAHGGRTTGVITSTNKFRNFGSIRLLSRFPTYLSCPFQDSIRTDRPIRERPEITGGTNSGPA